MGGGGEDLEGETRQNQSPGRGNLVEENDGRKIRF
jgi:hypothetical protein